MFSTALNHTHISATIAVDNRHTTEQTMHILVPIKVVPDYKIQCQLNEDATDIKRQNLKMILNPFDAIALQAAIDLKKQQPSIKITSLFISNHNINTQVRESLALGADDAVLVITDHAMDNLNIAKIIQQIITTLDSIQLVLMGKQAIDSDANQTAQMLATLLEWPNICFASALTIENNQVKAKCEWDEGLVDAHCQLPAVISCDLRLNKPTPANMMAIMKAKQKPLKTIPVNELNLSLKQHQQLVSLRKPDRRSGTQKVNSVEALVDIIKQQRG